MTPTIKREISLAKNKLEFTRKATDQRMTTTLPFPFKDDVELVSLYATLDDEDKITPSADFLKEVENMLEEKGCQEDPVKLE